MKYYFEVLLHLKEKKLRFRNICSKIFRNGYERVLFFVRNIRKKMSTEKEWKSIFFDSCWGVSWLPKASKEQILYEAIIVYTLQLFSESRKYAEPSVARR